MLPDFVTQQPMLWTIILASAGAIASLVVEHLARTLDLGRYGWQRRLRSRMGVADGRHIQELRWLTLSYQFVVWPFVAFLLLHVWGRHDLGERVRDALAGQGFTLGKTHIVPAQLLLGLLWFLLLVTFTRWLKKKLENDWLPLSGIEASVRVSVATLFGYVTFILASLVGLSVAGLDLSKLAIVAGALSVGIGFGLQNIFNNFVSGLILLFERPVRLGDYIRISGSEGFVRRIRIRSTELETWDRSSIIVPNSELLSKPVENTSYHDLSGRLILPVVVTHDCDPEQVQALLLKAAEPEEELYRAGEHFSLPAPFVLFSDFDNAVLRFELRAFLRDMNAKGLVASRIRYRIVSLFREHGVRMVAAQQDIRITGWPAKPE